MSAIDIEADRRLEEMVRDRFGMSVQGVETYFTEHAHRLAECAVAMADRFFKGAKLLVVGEGAAVSDAQHTAVEFVHPVLPGCRALPSLALPNDVGITSSYLETEHQDQRYAFPLRLLASPADIVIVFSATAASRASRAALEEGRRLKLLTVAVTGPLDDAVSADFIFRSTTEDPFVAQELQIGTYHVLWELIHIALNHRGISKETA